MSSAMEPPRTPLHYANSSVKDLIDFTNVPNELPQTPVDKLLSIAARPEWTEQNHMLREIYIWAVHQPQQIIRIINPLLDLLGNMICNERSTLARNATNLVVVLFQRLPESISRANTVTLQRLFDALFKQTGYKANFLGDIANSALLAAVERLEIKVTLRMIIEFIDGKKQMDSIHTNTMKLITKLLLQLILQHRGQIICRNDVAKLMDWCLTWATHRSPIVRTNAVNIVKETYAKADLYSLRSSLRQVISDYERQVKYDKLLSELNIVTEPLISSNRAITPMSVRKRATSLEPNSAFRNKSKLKSASKTVPSATILDALLYNKPLEGLERIGDKSESTSDSQSVASSSNDIGDGLINVNDDDGAVCKKLFAEFNHRRIESTTSNIASQSPHSDTAASKHITQSVINTSAALPLPRFSNKKQYSMTTIRPNRRHQQMTSARPTTATVNATMNLSKRRRKTELDADNMPIFNFNDVHTMDALKTCLSQMSTYIASKRKFGRFSDALVCRYVNQFYLPAQQACMEQLITSSSSRLTHSAISAAEFDDVPIETTVSVY